MIQLNVDFTLLNRFFGISTSKVSQYANKTFEQIMEIEAANGNKQAENYKQILSDPDKIKEIFKLSNVENKYLILQNMSDHDLNNLLPYLEQDQLAIGLNFFTEEKLVDMSKDLPVETLSEMIFSKFNIFDVLGFMEDEDMNEFLAQPKVDRKYSANYFESLKTEELQQIMMKAYGIEYKDKTKEECLGQLNSLSDDDFLKFTCDMDKKDKMNLIAGITEQNSDLLYLFDSYDLTRPMTMLMKDDMVKLMGTLDSEFLIPMIQELPTDLTQIVLTQIDEKAFSEVLADDFQDILEEVVLFQGGTT